MIATVVRRKKGERATMIRLELSSGVKVACPRAMRADWTVGQQFHVDGRMISPEGRAGYFKATAIEPA